MTDPNTPRGIEGTPDLWTRVREAGGRCLVLDYDGTLAPFRENRMRAFPVDGTVEALESIRDSGSTTLAILSGRPVHEVILLLGDLGITVVGSHGAELMRPGSEVMALPPSAAQLEVLDAAEQAALGVSSPSHVERKVSSVALHTRGMPPEDAAELERSVRGAWEQSIGETGLECRDFDGGIELRVLGRDKGSALRAFLRDLPPDTFCVYVGDDDTDEDAFRVVKDFGVGIKVGKDATPTSAAGRLEDPADVLKFLRTWDRITAAT